MNRESFLAVADQDVSKARANLYVWVEEYAEKLAYARERGADEIDVLCGLIHHIGTHEWTDHNGPGNITAHLAVAIKVIHDLERTG